MPKNLDSLRDSIRAYLQDCEDEEFNEIFNDYDGTESDLLEDLLCEEANNRYPDDEEATDA